MKCTRREFMSGLTLAGTAGLLGVGPETADAEPPPETTTLSVWRCPAVSAWPPVRRRRPFGRGIHRGAIRRDGRERGAKALASGQADLNGHFAAPSSSNRRRRIRSSFSPGSTRLFRTVRNRPDPDDPRPEGQDGRRTRIRRSASTFSSASMTAHVGLDPREDIKFVMHPAAEACGSSPRARSMPTSAFRPSPRSSGRRRSDTCIVNSSADRPWSQYFCCMLAGNRSSCRSTRSPPSERCGPS